MAQTGRGRVERASGPGTTTEKFGPANGGTSEDLSIVARLQAFARAHLPFAFVLLIPLIAGALTPDLSVRLFDGWTAVPSVKPSHWLTVGDLWFSLSVFGAILICRRGGLDVAIRTLLLAWGGLVLLSCAMLLSLAGDLEPGDLPSTRFVLGTALSWFAAAYVASAVYDLIRGGAWWRTPLFSLLIGFWVQSGISFVGIYAGSGLPWSIWLFADGVVDGVLALVFVLIYGALRPHIRPISGLGGR